MQIRVIIILSILLFESCSVLRVNQNPISSEENSHKVLIGIEKFDNSNISENSFSIQKAIIKIDEEKGRNQEFIGNIRYYNNDRFLISLRTVSGIEFVRVFVNSDSIFVLDRINKTIYEGSENSFYKKYGIRKDYILIFLGDIVKIKNSDFKILGGEGDNNSIQMISDSLRIMFKYNSLIGKAVNTKIIEHDKIEAVNIDFSNFQRIGNKTYPRSIDIHNLPQYKKLSIRVKKMKIPWEGEIRFIIGKEYNIIRI